MLPRCDERTVRSVEPLPHRGQLLIDKLPGAAGVRGRGRDLDVEDLREPAACRTAVRGIDEVYHLAADMGGIGYISAYHADIARNSALVNLHMLEAARQAGVRRFLFSSSACVYPRYRQ
ncbi:MAG: NAD-dependent epimerase/dehydratase family protein, partial [Firmicutes bacterium]|nr:NAD-dependent epimerase/dehydratase family protein [Bacillota bacterium]